MLKARTQYISALVPPPTTTNYKPFESNYCSIDSAGGTSTPRVSSSRFRSVSRGQQQQQHESVDYPCAKQPTVDPIDKYRRLKTTNSQITIDRTPFQNALLNQKVRILRSVYCIIDYRLQVTSGELSARRSDLRNKYGRNAGTPLNKENNVVDYDDDWNSDYSDDWEVDNEEPQSATIERSPVSGSKREYGSVRFQPVDRTAFDGSFCQKRQAAIDNMSYRQAVNKWTAKGLHDVVKLIMDLSADKSFIDRAWIIFYWVSQNIEYDVEAYFSGTIRHQTSEDIFANRKGVCDAFGTIFETLCSALKIECKKISGYAKGYSFKLGQNSFDRTNHAWNVIRLEGHWYLIDSTWGEGYLDKNKCNRKELNPFYFLVRPEQMIYRHFPEDPQWQLLATPISMNEFIRLPFLESTFFECNLEIVHPRHCDKVPLDAALGLAEVLVRAPPNIYLIGDISQAGDDKVKNGCLVQYDNDRQVWQCLVGPQHSGFHILALYTRREKQRMKSTNDDKNTYASAIQFGLDLSTNVIKTKTFPLTYGLFTERRCQIFKPLDGVLKSGSRVTIHCRIPGAHCARLLLDGNWLSKDLIEDDIFKKEITVPKQSVIIYVQFSDKRNSSSYDGLFSYSVK